MHQFGSKKRIESNFFSYDVLTTNKTMKHVTFDSPLDMLWVHLWFNLKITTKENKLEF